MRKVAVLSILAVLAAVVLLILLNRSDDGTPALPDVKRVERIPAKLDEGTLVALPDVTQVQKITARIYDQAKHDFYIDPVPEFEVPREHFSTLLDAISPAEKSSFGRGFGAIGEMAITTSHGEAFQIVLRWAGVNPVCFTVNGVDCIRGGTFQPLIVPQSDGNWHADESALLAPLIRDIYREKVNPKQVTRLKRLIEQLEISRGARPSEKAVGEGK
jgi:hypothetical protein